MGKPRINHVALSVDKALLDGEGRGKLIDFYTSVFGWEPIPQLTIDGRRLVFRLYEKGQFLYLITGQNPSVLAKPDHFGIQVDTKEEMDQMVEACRRFKAEKDDAVEIIDVKREQFESGSILYNTYFRYLLPLMVEIQYPIYATVDPVQSEVEVAVAG
jgi:hypothetical protein